MDTFENNYHDPVEEQNMEAAQEQPKAYEEPRADAEPTYEEPRVAPEQGSRDAWQYPGSAPKAPKKPKEKKKHGTGTVVAIALVCAILGGLGGGALTGYISSNRYGQQVSQLQDQVAALEEKGSKGGTTILTSVSADGLKSGAQIYAENVDAVVSVTSNGTTQSFYGTSQFQSRGTGFLISDDGYILTNQHVIDEATDIKITMNDGTEYEAQVVGSDEYFDVALLKIDAEGLPCVTIGDSDNTAVGEQVVLIGNALGELTSSFTGGYLSGVDRAVSTDGKAVNMMQTDAAINSGNSGGPLFNMQGEVIGITSAKYSGSTSSGASIEGIGFAIPINDVMKLVSDLKDYGYVTGQAYLGVTVKEMDVDQEVAKAYGLPLGVQVSSVDEGGAAEKAGIQAGDIITALGSDKVESLSTLQAALRKRSAGGTDTITVYRSGQELQLTITFDEKQVETESGPEATKPQENEQPQVPDEDAGWDEWYEFFNRYFGGR